MALKTTVITGATSGIGKETALGLAKKDHALYLLVRNVPKGEVLKKDIIAQTGNKNIHVIKCDLADLQSVREAADELNAKLVSINVLINNAGGIFAEKQLTKDGFEMTFATNHLGHFLLTLSLMPLLEKGHARVINVSSSAHQMGKPNFDDIQWAQHKYSAWRAYGMAKLYNLYFTKSLAEKYADKGVSSFAVHPGLVKTNFWGGTSGLFNKVMQLLLTPFMISAEEGAPTSIYLATEPGMEAKSSQYFVKSKLAKSTVLSWNEANRNKLWDISKKLVGKIETKK
jgi:NAD(P)-dependent dehydrogenase (short-subunit alcohol dehydrogenase family)